MKIIHTGDIHIGSPFKWLPQDKANMRQREIVDAFFRMVSYAKEEGIDAVLIAGDLFDNSFVSDSVTNEVATILQNASPVQFYLVFGNHDGGAKLPFIPQNVHTFNTSSFSTYEIGQGVFVTGVDTVYLTNALLNVPALDENRFHIMLLHGQAVQNTKTQAEDIPLAQIGALPVDYLALGHIHKPTPYAISFSARGKYRYCGCLESRGFDEIGNRGFFQLTIENNRIIEEKFLSVATRQVIEKQVDISSATTYFDMERLVLLALDNVSKKDMVKISLTGRYQPTLKKDLNLLFHRVAPNYFGCKVEDYSTLQMDYSAYENDVTERGEFIKAVTRYEMNDKLRAEVLEVGLKALAGENIDL